MIWFQCQKFGQFNKDDPNSFRLSESLSLYPQVKQSFRLFTFEGLITNSCDSPVLRAMPVSNNAIYSLSSSCSTWEDHRSFRCLITVRMSRPTTGIISCGRTWHSRSSWSSPFFTRTRSTVLQRWIYHPFIHYCSTELIVCFNCCSCYLFFVQPVLLDSSSILPDRILLMDTFFQLVIYHGEVKTYSKT